MYPEFLRNLYLWNEGILLFREDKTFYKSIIYNTCYE